MVNRNRLNCKQSPYTCLRLNLQCPSFLFNTLKMSHERNSNECLEILKVFRSTDRDSWKDNPDALFYLTDLCSAGLQRLHQEPDRLSEEKTLISEQTQDLAFHNYKTFIQTAECSHEIFQDFNIVESRLQSLLDKLPTFSEKCQDFGKHAQTINSRWHEASLMLTKYPQLLEFLEMPQLMETYSRNGYYEEALELASYIKRLERKHRNISIIKSIVTDVQSTLNAMLLQLLAQLRSNIQLPTCLKVVGFLRRMDVFSELELRVKFLQARGAWFEEILSAISKTDAYQHMIKVIECCRIHLFDIITQYRAIFSDDDPLLLTTKDYGESETAVFQSWITLKVSEFLDILQQNLNSDLGGRVDSVYSQCMYFGLSFSRVGIDFRPLLVPIFEDSMLSKFSSAVHQASLKFEEAMQSYTITNYGLMTGPAPLSPLSAPDDLHPPNSLLEFYPLAQYCNVILSALNDLKLCSSFAILMTVIKNLQESLIVVAKIIAGYQRMEKDTMTTSEMELFSKFCQEFASELLPHFDKCIVALFPPEGLARILGVTPLEFSKLEKLFCLDVATILLPLENILPSKDDDAGIVINIKAVLDSDNNEKQDVKENELE